MFSSSSNSCRNSSLIGGDGEKSTWESLKESAEAITDCDRALAIYYFFVLILVLILAGNLIQKGTKDKSIGWLAFSFCVLIGLAGMFLIFTGKHVKMIGIIIINVIIAALLMFAMIYINPDAPLTEKLGAHFANISFLIVSITAVVMTRKLVK
jgi:hypothetical protein